MIAQATSEARNPLARGALEAKAAITLTIGHGRDYATSRVSRSGAGVYRSATTLLYVLRQTEGTHHITIRPALPIHIADILLAGSVRVAELQTDTVTAPDIALAISDSVIDEAARLSAKRISLVLANYEGRLWIQWRIQMEGKRRDRCKNLDRR
jgi:hypothetical protein